MTVSNAQNDFEKAVKASDALYDNAFVAEMLKALEDSGIVLSSDIENKLYEAGKNFRESELGKALHKSRKETLDSLTP